MNRTLALVFLFLILTALSPAQTVQVSHLEQDSPIQVMSGQLQNFQYTSQLQLQLSGFPANSVISADFRLYIYRHGKIVAGEGWTEKSLTSEFTHDSRLHLSNGDQAIVAVQKIVTKERTYTIDEKVIVDAVKDQIKGKSSGPVYGVISSLIPTLRPAIVIGASPRLLLVDDYCGGRLEAAKAACGSDGIASFSCNDQNQSFSFTCKGNTPTQPPPGNK